MKTEVEITSLLKDKIAEMKKLNDEIGQFSEDDFMGEKGDAWRREIYEREGSIQSLCFVLGMDEYHIIHKNQVKFLKAPGMYANQKQA